MDLRQFTTQPAPASCFGAIASIESLAAWHAREGCVSIDDKKSEVGWQGLRCFFDYSIFCAKTHIEIANLVRASEAMRTWPPFHLLGIALTFRDEKTTQWLGDLVIQSRESKLLGRRWGSERRDPFQSFICELHCRGVGKAGFPDDFGPYTDVFRNWTRQAELADAIYSACDYHVKQIRTDGEFENNPHDIFPSEILALYRVREKLGLETPWVKHPLLETPFAQVPENITYDPDPLIVQAMELVTKLLPDALDKR